ncbi:MAG: DUF3459 domain-containing protein, partial [Bacteroidota bacterium]|nr:DUF3459 domain-containing protein [Bacteroidota bacterium]
LYSGQELPNNKRLQFFEKDVIDWNKNIELHSFYQSLFELKKSHPALAANASVEILPATGSLFVFKRKERKREVLCLLNFSNSEKNFQLEQASIQTGSFNLLDRDVKTSEDGSILLPPWSFALIAN